MNNFPRYDSYKDSGITWIGKIPGHWKVQRLKTICNINQNSLPENTNKDLSLEYVDIGSVTFENGITETQKLSFKDAPSRARRIAKVGDTVISAVRTYLKAIDYIDEIKAKYIYSTGFAVLSPNEIDPNFLAAAVRSDAFTNQVDMFSTGISYPAINSTALSSLYIPIPPMSEQIAIAEFLNCRTAQIDKAIAQKERLIALLQERRQILIHKAVTRGLNPNVKMKHNGVDRIGEIPEHWQIVSNFALFEERNEAGREDLPILMVSIHTAVSSDEISDEENIRGKVRIKDKTSYKLVKPGDIVFNMMRAWQGAIGAVTNEGMVSPAYIVAKPKREFSSVFLEFQFRTQDYIQQIDRYSKGITDFRKRLYWNEFTRLKTILPPIEEQRAISEFITNLNEKTERAVAAKRKEIEKLKEYKAVLIDSAVTGKIKVCDQIQNEEMKANYA
jgi:type I restriction enzyme S subunit